MPVPISLAMGQAIHGMFHLIKIGNLVVKWSEIDSTNMRIERAEQNGNICTNSVHSALASIVEACKTLWRDVQKSHCGIILHLLIAALHGVCVPLGGVSQLRCLIQSGIIGTLAYSKQYTNTLPMETGDCLLERITG